MPRHRRDSSRRGIFPKVVAASMALEPTARGRQFAQERPPVHEAMRMVFERERRRGVSASFAMTA